MNEWEIFKRKESLKSSNDYLWRIYKENIFTPGNGTNFSQTFPDKRK